MRQKQYKITAFVSDKAGAQLDKLAIENRGNKTKAIEQAINHATKYNLNELIGQYNVFLELQKRYTIEAENRPETFGPLLQPLAFIISKYAEAMAAETQKIEK